MRKVVCDVPRAGRTSPIAAATGRAFPVQQADNRIALKTGGETITANHHPIAYRVD